MVEGEKFYCSQRLKMCPATTQRLLFIAIHLISLSAAAEDKLTCPPSEWKEGEKYTLTCTVRTSEFNDEQCQNFSGLVDFQITLEGSDPAPQCIVQNAATSCGGSLNSKGCRCREKTSEAYVLEFEVKANKSQHEGGTWRCVPNCIDGNDLSNKYEKPPFADNLQCDPVSVSSASCALYEHGLCNFLLLLISLSGSVLLSSR